MRFLVQGSADASTKYVELWTRRQRTYLPERLEIGLNSEG